MLEYMGAWEWYEKQVNLATTTILTKKGKLVDRKGAATHVLNTMWSTQREAAPRGRWIGGLGNVAIEQEGDNADLDLDGSNAGVTAKDRQLQRKRISVQLSRGQKLSTKLVKELGLGILFSPKIWEYTKMHGEQLERSIRNIQADAGRMQLLRILGPQLEQLVYEGQTDLHTLYNAIYQEKLVSPKELQDLRVTFALNSVNN
ncbi:hypothetical protein MMC13_005912 [Lambiella insularis]|nr:hypothetical protein [Lambiella insularis]